MPDPFDPSFIGSTGVATVSLLTALVQKLMMKGLLTKDEVNDMFEAALQGIESIPTASQPQLQVARALLDAQAQLLVTGRLPKSLTE